MTKILVIGAAGRMGRTIVSCIEDTEGVELSGGTENPGNSSVGSDVGELAGIGKKNIAVGDCLETAVKSCDVVIDFTTPDCSMETFRVAVDHIKPLVIGTTGFSASQKQQIQKWLKRTRCVMAPNMSIGVNVLFKVVRDMAQALGDAYDVEIVEAHHKFKKDAPSGTAVRISEIVAEALHRNIEEVGVYGRQGITERTPKEIGVHTLRAGDIVGEHRVLFGGMGENLEIFHRAQSRETFARGAVRAAQWLVNQPVGLYDMQDVLGFRKK
ncbi:MAG: 4-hydroxy-tetrahydrodipicolinate reductase [Nitrospinaceae bacterium]|nr:MAG: 4-hydroxy-tetrahydrodipicolinate reductase [Nitrospinaceae bacterium]